MEGDVSESLIMYMLAHAHFIEYGNDIPTGIELNNDMKPVGALVLSLQAICILFFNFLTS